MKGLSEPCFHQALLSLESGGVKRSPKEVRFSIVCASAHELQAFIAHLLSSANVAAVQMLLVPSPTAASCNIEHIGTHRHDDWQPQFYALQLNLYVL